MIVTYEPMTAMQLGFLLLAGAAATGGQFCITAAYRQAPAKEIAVFDYMQVFFAAILGYLFLDQLPKTLSIVGYVIIIGAAVGQWAYHLVRARRAQSAAAVTAQPTAGTASATPARIPPETPPEPPDPSE